MQVNGRWASSTNPATWSNFDEVQTGPGVGFGVMVGNGVGVYDLDGALTESGDVEPWAREVLAGIHEPVLFAEVSVSGRGVHVFVKAGERRGSRSAGVEFYSRDRFIRTTLQPFDMSVVE